MSTPNRIVLTAKWSETDDAPSAMPPPPMTAAELHAVYGPLHEAVPATRPVMPGLSNWGGPTEPRRLYLQSPEGGACILPVEAAAFLCRGAAEDWLRANCEHIRLYNDEHFGYVTVGVQRDADPYDSPLAYGHKPDTIHHALVAACLAVAGVKHGAA